MLAEPRWLLCNEGGGPASSPIMLQPQLRLLFFIGIWANKLEPVDIIIINIDLAHIDIADMQVSMSTLITKQLLMARCKRNAANTFKMLLSFFFEHIN